MSASLQNPSVLTIPGNAGELLFKGASGGLDTHSDFKIDKANSQLLIGDGTNANPALAFKNTPATGLVRSSNTRADWCSNGSTNLIFYGSGSGNDGAQCIGQFVTNPFNGGKLIIGGAGTPMKFMRWGTAVLVGGTVIVADANISANSKIGVTRIVPAGTLGTSIYSNPANNVAGVSFQIDSNNVLETSTVLYMIFEAP